MIGADLTGRVAIVTGGASGIGAATARLLHQCGAHVVVNYLPGDDKAAAAVQGLVAGSPRYIAGPCDVASTDDVTAMIGRVRERFGRLDVLVNNAGISGTNRPIPFADLDAMTDGFWNSLLSVNLVGAFHCAKACAPMLGESEGCIVNVASVAGLGTRGSSIAYAASKAGLISLTRSLAVALAPKVRVNAVAPGLVDTPWISAWDEQRKQTTTARTLLGRPAQPDEVAQAILFLMAGASYMTGQVLVLDGGAA